MACSTSEESFTPNSQPELINPQTELTNIYNKIDSIKSAYSITVPHTRGFGKWAINNISEAAADHVGSIVGSWLGKNLGAAAGAAIGNPVVAVAGYVGGRSVGRIVGFAAASYAASRVLERFSHHEMFYLEEPALKNSITHEFKFGQSYIDRNKEILHEMGDSLSSGVVHNLILNELMANGNKYINPDSTINYNVLLDDCAFYAEKYDSINYEASTLANHKKDIIEQTKIICSSVLDFSDQQSLSRQDFYNNVYDNIQPLINIDKEAFNQQANIGLILGDTYYILEKEDLKKCEKEVNKVIEDSRLADDIKYELKYSNNAIANSTLYWKETHVLQYSKDDFHK